MFCKVRLKEKRIAAANGGTGLNITMDEIRELREENAKLKEENARLTERCINVNSIVTDENIALKEKIAGLTARLTDIIRFGGFGRKINIRQIR